MTFYGLALHYGHVDAPGDPCAFFRQGFIGCSSSSSRRCPFIDNSSRSSGSPPRSRVQWPPYIPPSIAQLADWTREDEMIMSDMPWAVAWYADRKSLWLPMTIKAFIDLNDYNQLKGQDRGHVPHARLRQRAVFLGDHAEANIANGGLSSRKT